MIFSRPKRILAILFTLSLLFVLGTGCVPRCTKFPQYAQCKVRMRHEHQGIEFRGVPWWRRQHLQYGQKVRKKAKRDPHHKTKTPKNSKKDAKKRVIIRNN